MTMKLMFASFLLLFQFGTVPQSGTMVRAEKMTADELTELQAAKEQVATAQARLNVTYLKIAGQHKMTSETWMEWQTWYEFDGDFIVQRSHNSMTGIHCCLTIGGEGGSIIINGSAGAYGGEEINGQKLFDEMPRIKCIGNGCNTSPKP